MLSWIFEQIASLRMPKPTPEEQATAALRYIERGPGEVAFEQRLAGAWAKKRNDKIWHSFNSASTPEAKTAVILQMERDIVRAADPNSDLAEPKKIQIVGFDYPPDECEGLRLRGLALTTLIAPDGTPHSIEYRTYC